MDDWLKELDTLIREGFVRTSIGGNRIQELLWDNAPELVESTLHIQEATAAHSYRLMGQTWLRSAQQLIDAGDDEVSTMREFGYVRVSELDALRSQMRELQNVILGVASRFIDDGDLESAAVARHCHEAMQAHLDSMGEPRPV